MWKFYKRKTASLYLLSFYWLLESGSNRQPTGYANPPVSTGRGLYHYPFFKKGYPSI